jgi:hypothetical protein
MSDLIIGFSRPKSWLVPFSWIIRLVTWSPVSHAYVRYYDSYANTWVIFQASGLVINMVSQEMFLTKDEVYAEFEIPISEDMKQKIVQNSINKCGTPYGIWQIFGFAWILFMRLFGKSVKNPFYSSSSYFCSELVGDILIEVGDKNIDPSAMTPKDDMNYLFAQGLKTLSGQSV